MKDRELYYRLLELKANHLRMNPNAIFISPSAFFQLKNLPEVKSTQWDDELKMPLLFIRSYGNSVSKSGKRYTVYFDTYPPRSPTMDRVELDRSDD